LAQLLSDFPKIASYCTLIFVPGDNDPWSATFSGGATPVWPLTPVPSLFTTRVKRVAPKSVWASNPSRLAYLMQEIVLVRDDYGDRFRRNCIPFDEYHAEGMLEQ
jgi:DNA polymerase epsilon subunit 2